VYSVVRFVLSGVISIWFIFQAEDGIRNRNVTGVQTCALPISIASFGMIQEKIADMNVSLFAAESAVYRTSGLLDDIITSVSEKDDATIAEMGQALGEYQLECAVNKFSASEMLDKEIGRASCRE